MQLPQSLVIGGLYNVLVSVEVGVIRWIDRLFYCTQTDTNLSSLTAVIKTFERPKVLTRLLKSLKRCYPDLRVIVVDDSKNPKPIEGAEWIQLPFDSGVSLGRSTGLSQVKTPYVLIMDDDFVMTRSSGVREALLEMEKYPMIDIMGGEVVKLPFFSISDYRVSGMFPTNAHSVLPLGSKVGPYPVYDKVPNFYIARTERLRLVDWDPKIKRMDHAEFFTRAKGVLVTVMNKKLRCLHANTPFDRHYRQFRDDIMSDINHIREKYSQLE